MTGRDPLGGRRPVLPFRAAPGRRSFAAALGRMREFAATARALGSVPTEQWRVFWWLTKNLRAQLGLASYHPDRVLTLATRYGRLHLRDNFGDVTNLPDLFHHGVYRIRAVSEPGAILDVGANIGLFAAWAAFHNPDRPIYCFEPLVSNTRLIALNCPQAVVHNVAVGASRGTVRLRIDSDGVMASAVPTAWPTAEDDLAVVPLDDLTEADGVAEVAFLKIDTEGMEADVLEGAPATLARTMRVAMETHSAALHRTAVAQLASAGFRIDDAEFCTPTGLVFASRSERGAA